MSGENVVDPVMAAIVKQVRKAALGPLAQITASAWPLQSRGGENEADDWWGTSAARSLGRRTGPVITCWNDHEWCASVLVDKRGVVTVAVPAGTRVVEVKR